MNKADIVDKVHSVLGSTKADAERAVETVIDSIVSGLKSGNEVSIAGLGIFATKARPARQGRNPAPARRFTSTPLAPRSSAPQRRSRTQLSKGFVLKTAAPPAPRFFVSPSARPRLDKQKRPHWGRFKPV